MSEQSKVLIVGGGTAGIKSALELANHRIPVTVIDRSPFIVGKLSQLDKQFPTNTCTMCQMIPITNDLNNTEYCLKRDLSNPFIELKSQTGILSYSKNDQGFSVKFRTAAAFVDPDKCIACDKCTEVCPEKTTDEFEENLTKRKAIYQLYPFAVPNSYIIDKKTCSNCGKCVEVCPTHAISLDRQDREWEGNFKNIILTTGFDLYDPEPDSEYGYQRFKNVYTSMQMERILSPMGPYEGNIKKKFGKNPRIAFLQCIGSRNTENPYCSSACCMYAIKEAMLIKEALPQAEISIFYMDLRTYGKGYYRYQEKAKNEYGVKYINTRISNIEQVESDKLLMKFEDEEAKPVSQVFDAAVLSTGQKVNIPEPFKNLTDKNGFISNTGLDLTKTEEEGIYAVGSIISPVDIPDTVVQATGAVSDIIKHHDNKIKKPEYVHVQDEKTGVIISNGLNRLSDDVLVSIRNNSKLDVVEVQNFFYLEENFKKFISLLKKHDLNRILLLVEDLTLDKELLKKKITDHLKYYDLHVEVLKYSAFNEKDIVKQVVNLKIEKILNEKAFTINYDTMKNFRVLVIGGGLAGVFAAQSLAESGIKIDIIENQEILGGNVKKIKTTLDGKDAWKYLKEKIKFLEQNESVRIFTGSEILKSNGYHGNYQVTFKTADAIQSENYSMIIVATGARENIDSNYGYGANKAVISQLDLTEKLNGKNFIKDKKAIAMIQCVNSRNENHPHCSRVCCSAAIKNALKIKELNPETEVYILYRDIMTYGKHELKYTEAREKGIIFLRYNRDEEISVNSIDDKINLEFYEGVLKAKLNLELDVLVLSFGLTPAENSDKVAEILKLPVNEDGFFKEANVKYRPIETERTGILVIGTANAPMNIYETIQQANAAIVRVLEFAKKERIRARDEISVISSRRCSGCQICIEACPYEARYFDEDRNIAQVINSLCQGCGLCTMACPNNATELIGQETKTIRAMIDSII